MAILDHGPVFILSIVRAISQWDDGKCHPWPIRGKALSQKLECLEDSDIHHGDIVSSPPVPPWSADIMMSLSESRMSPAYCSALDPLSCPIWSMPHLFKSFFGFPINYYYQKGIDLKRCSWWKLETLDICVLPNTDQHSWSMVLFWLKATNCGKDHM